MRWVLRSKIHKATVTDTNLEYVGSLTIDSELIEKAGFLPGEKILVVDNTSGTRLETYVMVGDPGSGVMQVNGAASHLIHTGDEITIMGFELTDKPLRPKLVLVDRENRFVRFL
jgi:aspartate 1-decarboxylase